MKIELYFQQSLRKVEELTCQPKNENNRALIIKQIKNILYNL